MAKPFIVVADRNEEYASTLELTLLERFDDRIELEIITEEEYFKSFFEQERVIEVLIISEELYSSGLLEKNITQIAILKEKIVQDKQDNPRISEIFKYSSPNMVCRQIIENNTILHGLQVVNHSNGTKVIVVYSPIGGVGKTTLALGISGCVARKKQKVLYMDAEEMNTFQYYLQDKSMINNKEGIALGLGQKDLYQQIKGLIRTEGMDYLPPFQVLLSALKLDVSIYKRIIESVKASGEYDFIIVDTDTVLDKEKARLFAVADKIVLVGKQDTYSQYVMDVLQQNLDDAGEDKITYVYNQYEAVKDYHTIEPITEMNVHVAKLDDMERADIEKLSFLKDIEHLALLVM